MRNWGEDKGTMSKAYVEEVINKHFAITNINHESQLSNRANCPITLKRVVFEIKAEDGKQYFKYRSVKNLEENVESVFLYSR
jgi:hypothetical protein